jgi:hypothetical protein
MSRVAFCRTRRDLWKPPSLVLEYEFDSEQELIERQLSFGRILETPA